MVGAINVDLVVIAPRLPGPGQTVVGAGPERHGGGKGANAAVAAARADADVLLVGAVGEDETGAATLEELDREGVDVSAVATLPGEATGVALIVVDSGGENQIAVGAGANGAVSAGQVREALAEHAAELECVLVSTEIPGEAVAAAVGAAAAAGVRCVLNTAPPITEIPGLLSHGPVLTPNATELAQLAGMLEGPAASEGAKGPDRVATDARRLAERTGAPVVVTLGSDGVLVLDGEARHIAAPPVTVRDTTGAGDTFNGVLAARLAAGDDLARAAGLATVAASLSVGTEGARHGMPTATAIAAAAASAPG